MIAIKKIVLAMMLTFAVGLTAAPTTAQANQGHVASVSVFYEPMAQYGDWYYTAQYGYVWTPYQMNSTWRPYTQGHWVWTDAHGWMWVSDEPWAWAAYHYGRWAWLDGVWVWVPDTTWGPAWVAWNQADGYVGWAPLPPGASVGAYSGTVNINVNIGWQYWTYVPAAQMLSVNLYPYYLPPHRVQVVWRHSTPMTRYRVVQGHVMCLGLSTAWVGGYVGYAIPSVSVTWTNTPGAYYNQGTVYVYRRPPPPPTAYRYAPPPPQRAVPAPLRSQVTTPPPPRSSYTRGQPASPPPPSRNTTTAPPPRRVSPPPPVKSAPRTSPPPASRKPSTSRPPAPRATGSVSRAARPSTISAPTKRSNLQTRTAPSASPTLRSSAQTRRPSNTRSPRAPASR